ncbi:hypothetical protein [Spiroplasma corruscae]|nr:hypothetical protein [Spiroplasma corruscae]
MNIKDAYTIIIIVTWLVSFLISLFLYLIFKNKYKKLKLYLNLKKDNINFFRESTILNEIEIKFELPRDESCYLYNNEILLYNYKNKNINKNFKNNENIELYITNKRVLLLIQDIYIKYDLKQISNYFLDQKYINGEWIPTIVLTMNKEKYILINNSYLIYFTLLKIMEKENING